MESIVQKHCLIYLRVSSAKQAQQGESIQDQKKICERVAERYQLNVLQVFSEQFSGRKNERPVIEDIVSYIKSHPNRVKFLIFRAIDRFTRNGTLGYESLKQRLAWYGVALIDANGVIQPSKNTLEHLGVEYEWSITRPSEITELVMAQQGKSEVNTILTRMIGAEINLVREGYKVRQADDGYINEKVFIDGKKKIVQKPDPHRAKFFTKMFEMSITHTDQEVVDYVNAMGYRSREQKIWSKPRTQIIGTRGGIKLTIRQLQKIRQRPIYTGINTEKWLETPIRTQYKGLIDIDVFNKANKGKVYIEEHKDGLIRILKDYNPHQLKRMKDNPLFPHKEVVLCPICVRPFLGSSPTGKSGKRFPVYHCARKHKYFGVSKKEFEKQLINFVSKLKYKNEAFFKVFEVTLMNKFKEKEKELGEFSVQVGSTVIELEAKKKQAIEAFMSTKNEIIRTELENKIEDLHLQIETYRQQRNGIEVQENDIHAFVRYVKNLMEHPVERLVKQKNLNALRGLFSLVFEELPTYNQILNGTPKLSLPYKLSEEFQIDKSSLVNSPYLRWNTIQNMVIQWNGVFNTYNLANVV